MSNKVKGTVKWFNNKKGFGFIEQESGPDLYAHASSISRAENSPIENQNNKEDYKVLIKGQVVEFTVADSDKGPIAEDIIVL